jgi:retron-type reverse transcriptase
MRRRSTGASDFIGEHTDHHQLMKRVRTRVADGKVTRLIAQFLQGGVLSDGFLLPTGKGTPQGGVISPLFANIALGVIEERYERWTHHQNPGNLLPGMRMQSSRSKGTRCLDKKRKQELVFSRR